MTDSKQPLSKRSSQSEVDAFLKRASSLSNRPQGRGRLVFAMDATASRELTWSQASSIQGEMFARSAALGGLEVQLVYYRGFAECRASRWTNNSLDLLALMGAVSCIAGRTQIERVLKHTATETEAKRIDALVFVGDAMEEGLDSVAHQAARLGLLGVPIFAFHEGSDPRTIRAFSEMAKLSNGACCQFDSNSPQQLSDLLAAVAVYASGGQEALKAFSTKQGGVTQRLIHQLKE
ncbi:MAG: hypothetical protein QF586_05330 [Arenicellales bacterium]|jgi:hypothetical protein|nr:hypothetical protein [Acidiferrobacteraceae bacterium]MDP6123703.1 hypothetical protein [Arenicellales bacterium]MDP6289625.1 hypothetical protein [Arenicellales bacterium]MDP7155923.1 hypothetical protein [Arenicellales bacterium]MDP7482567.1 hypothetical protein [Arenicellales bacterium]|tara:strand:- start:858 stop:1562 length:705 start_codon:yes stop_codon:yes gene_type:complete